MSHSYCTIDERASGRYVQRSMSVRYGTRLGDLNDDDPFLVLPETKFSVRYIPVWARYSHLRTRVEAHATTLSP